jgi:hypothetical protein
MSTLIRISRRALALCATAAIVATSAAIARADGITGANCDPSKSQCTVTAVGPGGHAPGGSGNGAASNGGVSDPNASTIVPGVPDRCLAVWTPPPGALPAQYSSLDVNPADGVWYTSTCPQYGNGPGIPSYFQGIAPGAGIPAVPLAVVAQQAEKQLNLPAPVIESSPGGGAPQTVQLPTWAWLPAAQWAPLSATASVPGESATATATPISVTWSWGDGTSTVCKGAGTAYVKGVSDPAAPSPDCGHTYRQTSANQPGQQVAVTATIAWNVAWNGGGRTGVFPGLTTTATARWIVRQIQSLIVNP